MPLHRSKDCVYGTDGYAPPEQYQGKPVPRSDVFALAATAYHLLTDDDPRQHPFKFPRLPDLPKELGIALERALRTNPEQRSTARELRQALETLASPKRTLEALHLSRRHADPQRGRAARPVRRALGRGALVPVPRRLSALAARHQPPRPGMAADEIVKREQNHDAGLEEFLHVVDPGLPHPKLVARSSSVDLGRIARESAILRRVTLLNSRARVHARPGGGVRAVGGGLSHDAALVGGHSVGRSASTCAPRALPLRASSKQS